MVKLDEVVLSEASVAVRVKLKTPAVVGVPAMEDELSGFFTILKPSGSDSAGNHEYRTWEERCHVAPTGCKRLCCMACDNAIRERGVGDHKRRGGDADRDGEDQGQLGPGTVLDSGRERSSSRRRDGAADHTCGGIQHQSRGQCARRDRPGVGRDSARSSQSYRIRLVDGPARQIGGRSDGQRAGAA